MSQLSPQPATYSLPPKPVSAMAIISLILGIISLIPCLTWIGILLGIAAIVLAILALQQVRAGQAGGGGLAKSGLVLGIIGIVIGLVAIVVLRRAGSFLQEKAQELQQKADEMQKQAAEAQRQIEEQQRKAQQQQQNTNPPAPAPTTGPGASIGFPPHWQGVRPSLMPRFA